MLLLTFILAATTWRYVEQPFRNRGATCFYSLHSLLAIAIGVTLFFPALNFANREFNLQYGSYFYLLGGDARRAYQLSSRHTGYDFTAAMRDDGACRFWVPEIDDQAVQKFTECEKTHGPATIILGDSHSMNVYNMYFNSAGKAFLLGVVQPGCRPDSDYRPCHYEGFSTFAQKHSAAIEEIVFHQSGSYLMRDANGYPDSQLLFEQPEATSLSHENVKLVSNYLEELAQFSRVTWLGPFPEVRIRVEDPIALANAGFEIPANRLALFERIESELRPLASRSDHYEYISLVDRLNLKPNDLVLEDCLTFRDKDHISRCGENIFGERFLNPPE